MHDERPFTIERGFEPRHRDRVVELYWEAFGAKLEQVMRPEATALEFLRGAVDPAWALSARASDGQLLGVAGFKTRQGAFVGGGLRDLGEAYGRLGGLWRGFALALLERPLEQGTLRMDGLFVTAEARGRGVGSALLDAVKDEARARGCG